MARKTRIELLDLAKRALQGQGFSPELASEVSEEFVVAELSGVPTHGMGKLASLDLGVPYIEPIVTRRGAIVSVDGRRGNGMVLLRTIADVVAQVCKEHGIATAFVRNFSRYSSLYPYTVRLAREGLVALLTNSAGPSAVAPYGSIDRITGTNPICFSFPTGGEPQTFEFATSEVVWGAIRAAALANQPLPPDAFLDVAGHVTRDPSAAYAVRSFGGTKGWTLNLAIEIIAGLLGGGKAGLDVASEFDCGAWLLAIDPAATGALEAGFHERLQMLFAAIRASRPETVGTAVRVPGDRGRSRVRVDQLPEDPVELSDRIIELLDRMANGERVTELAAQPLFN